MLVRLVDRFSRRSLVWLNLWVGLINWESRVGEMISVDRERLQEVVTNYMQNNFKKDLFLDLNTSIAGMEEADLLMPEEKVEDWNCQPINLNHTK